MLFVGAMCAVASLRANSIAAPQVAPGYAIEVYASGFVNPNSLAFSPGGTFGYTGQLFVGDARPDPGTIYRVPAKGVVHYFTDAHNEEPRSLEFGPLGSTFEGSLYLARAWEIVAISKTGEVREFFYSDGFTWDIAFPSQSPFGEHLFYADGWGSTVWRVTPAASKTAFVTNLPSQINGLAFSSNPSFGANLYLAFARGEGPHPGYGTSAIRYVTPDGVLDDFVTSPKFGNTCQLAFDTTGSFRGNLFVADSTENTIWEIDPAGNVAAFATGFTFDQTSHYIHINDGADLVFGPDGALYVPDLGAGAVYRVYSLDLDCDDNGIPDHTEVNPSNDCNQNRELDFCELKSGRSADCNFNGAPDECDIAPPVTLLEVDFDEALPLDWSTSGLWHVSNACGSEGPCSAGGAAYFGNDESCSLGDGQRSAGVLTAPIIQVPEGAQLVRIEFCSNYEGERGGAPSGFDSAWVTLNGALLVDIGADATLSGWQAIATPLPLAGADDISLAWHFDTVDGRGNAGRGWQLDQFRLIAEGIAQHDCDRNGVLDACDPDCDRNGVPDPCETDADDDGIPDPCDQKGDANHDAYVDLTDCIRLFVCIGFHAGPNTTPLFPECNQFFDFDTDHDVDLQDMAVLQRSFTGSPLD